MRRDFTNFDDLMDFVNADKEASGAMSASRNRFPVRFVLFDNFQDSYLFVSKVQESGCMFKSVNDWLDINYPDTMLTYSELSNCILNYASNYNADCIITPFSELARFYNNENSAKEFDALVKTIKGIENNSTAAANNRRIYIPIVGLEGKMSLFENDTQCTIWYLKNNDKTLTYNLLLTNNTFFGLTDLSQFNVARNVNEWLDVWKAQPAVKPMILCSSSAIYANARFAQPDNAFNFIICENAYDFLAKGLQLNFGEISYKESDKLYWARLASEITDIKSFTLEKFFNSYFHIDNLADYNVFLKTWFECKDDFEKWLLSTYYAEKFCNDGYICQVINSIQGYSNVEFFSAVALSIFNLDTPNKYKDERMVCLQAANNHNITLPKDVEYTLQDELIKLAETSDYASAISYFSPLTDIEKTLAIQWFAENKITKDHFRSFYTDLYNYLETTVILGEQWLNEYFDNYKYAKLTNQYTSPIIDFIKEKNASELTFNAWCQNLKTTKTILSGRSDIEVFYWIDGLGVEWIPLIQKCIEQKQSEGVYLNEIYVARSLYPTTTENNKKALMELSGNNLIKCGDLDTHAHQNTNKFPTYILEEIEIVNKALEKIFSEYNGKKIAIISDHGLTALAQLCDGLNMAGVESDHHGRLAYRKIGNCVSNSDYILCDDGKTMCALTHKSICGKVPNVQSAHGGCTPEEILVPIFVISSQKQNSHWKATLLTKTLSESIPIVKYQIKGISSIDVPYVNYNGKQYMLSSKGDNVYQSEKLSLSQSVKTIELVISGTKQTDTIDIKLGAEEDDLFNF